MTVPEIQPDDRLTDRFSKRDPFLAFGYEIQSRGLPYVDVIVCDSTTYLKP